MQLVTATLAHGEIIIEIVPLFKSAAFILVVTNRRMIWAVSISGQLVPRRECSLLLFVHCDRPSPAHPPLLRLLYIIPPLNTETLYSHSDERAVNGDSAPPDSRNSSRSLFKANSSRLSRSVFKAINLASSSPAPSSAQPASSERLRFVDELPPLPPGGYQWSGYVVKRGACRALCRG